MTIARKGENIIIEVPLRREEAQTEIGEKGGILRGKGAHVRGSARISGMP